MTVLFARDYNTRQLVAYHPETQAIYAALPMSVVNYYQSLAMRFREAVAPDPDDADCQLLLDDIREQADLLYNWMRYDFQPPWGEEMGGFSREVWQGLGVHSLVPYASYADYLRLDADVNRIVQTCYTGPEQIPDLEPEDLDVVFNFDFPEEPTDEDGDVMVARGTGQEVEFDIRGAIEAGDAEAGERDTTGGSSTSTKGKLAVAGGVLLGLGILGWAMKE